MQPWRDARNRATDRLITSVRVFGLGKVGELVATLLADAGFAVVAYDVRARSGLPFPTAALDVGRPHALAAALIGADAVVACLPFHLNRPVAEAAFIVCEALHLARIQTGAATTMELPAEAF